MDVARRRSEALAEPPQGPARQRILDAAYGVLARSGYAETSIKEIAREAGVAPGLVHYYFESKEDLLLEVVREVCRRYNAEIQEIPIPADPIEASRIRLSWARERVRRIPDWYRLHYDLCALALRDPKLGAEVKVMTREFREHIRVLVTQTASLLQADPGLSHDAVASVLMAAFNGIAFQALIDPEFDLPKAYEALERMTVGLLLPRG